jgi:hypothetical protein
MIANSTAAAPSSPRPRLSNWRNLVNIGDGPPCGVKLSVRSRLPRRNPALLGAGAIPRGYPDCRPLINSYRHNWRSPYFLAIGPSAPCLAKNRPGRLSHIFLLRGVRPAMTVRIYCKTCLRPQICSLNRLKVGNRGFKSPFPQGGLRGI